MNKRIEEELADWRHRHFNGKRDGEHSGEYLERTSQLEIAQHFYDLALEDVKKECERRRKLSTKNHDESSTKDVKLLYGGHIGAYTHIIDFINNQKQ